MHSALQTLRSVLLMDKNFAIDSKEFTTAINPKKLVVSNQQQYVLKSGGKFGANFEIQIKKGNKKIKRYNFMDALI